VSSSHDCMACFFFSLFPHILHFDPLIEFFLLDIIEIAIFLGEIIAFFFYYYFFLILFDCHFFFCIIWLNTIQSFLFFKKVYGMIFVCVCTHTLIFRLFEALNKFIKVLGYSLLFLLLNFLINLQMMYCKHLFFIKKIKRQITCSLFNI